MRTPSCTPEELLFLSLASLRGTDDVRHEAAGHRQRRRPQFATHGFIKAADHPRFIDPSWWNNGISRSRLQGRRLTAAAKASLPAARREVAVSTEAAGDDSPADDEAMIFFTSSLLDGVLPPRSSDLVAESAALKHWIRVRESGTRISSSAALYR